MLSALCLNWDKQKLDESAAYKKGFASSIRESQTEPNYMPELEKMKFNVSSTCEGPFTGTRLRLVHLACVSPRPNKAPKTLSSSSGQRYGGFVKKLAALCVI